MKIHKRIACNLEKARQFQLDMESRIAGFDRDLQSAIAMTSWELIENGLKYHLRADIRAPLDFRLDTGSYVTIAVQNRLADPADAASLTAAIDEIGHAKNPAELYNARLEEILEHRVKSESRLGLLKIRCEAEFGLRYSVKRNKVAVIAERILTHEEKDEMEPLYYDDLIITVSQEPTCTLIVWRGKSRSLDPEKVLDTYFQSLLTELTKQANPQVIMDFTALAAMNSSTIPPLLTFIKNMEKSGIRAYIVYKGSEHWQKASFLPLSVLTRSYMNVRIKANTELTCPIEDLFV